MQRCNSSHLLFPHDINALLNKYDMKYNVTENIIPNNRDNYEPLTTSVGQFCVSQFKYSCTKLKQHWLKPQWTAGSASHIKRKSV